MKMQVESPVTFLDDKDDNYEMLQEFNWLLKVINDSVDEAQLRKLLKRWCGNMFFDYGFGGSHMWAAQKSTPYQIVSNDRVIFVEM